MELPAKDFISGTSDPYVKIMLLPEKRSKMSTSIKRRNLNPRWNEIFAFEGTAVSLRYPRNAMPARIPQFFYVFFISVTFFYIYYFPNFLKFRAASRLTRSTFKITATKFNGFIDNRILNPVVTM